MTNKSELETLVSEIKKSTKQISINKVDEVRVMKSMLNDKDFTIGIYDKNNGYIGQKSPHNEAVKFAILTGGEETAYKMLEANPTLLLSAETGGKNATIVSKFADRDSAIKNIIHSAFSKEYKQGKKYTHRCTTSTHRNIHVIKAFTKYFSCLSQIAKAHMPLNLF